MEKLICKAFLWKTGLITCENYNEALNEMFLGNTESNILLELESSPLDYDFACEALKRYWQYGYKDFSADIFGKCLLKNLKAIYQSDAFTMETFGKKCFSLWWLLPDELKFEKPFHILSYADDPLSWDDEKQSKKIYEELFDFYE